MGEKPDKKKYVVFEEAKLYEMLGTLALPPYQDFQGHTAGEDWDCAPIAEWIKDAVEANREKTLDRPMFCRWNVELSAWELDG